MVSRADESVLRRVRALMELGRRASSDTVLLLEVADMIRDPGTGGAHNPSVPYLSPCWKPQGSSLAATSRRWRWLGSWLESGRLVSR